MFSITANDEFFPQGVGIDPQGHVFVSDFANNRILKFSNTGHFIREWGTSGSDNGQFNNPFQVAVDSQGNVFIADSFNNRIQKFSNTGTFIAKWGTEGSGGGQFIEPFGVAVDPQGHVFVSDASNHRIQKFSNTGSFIRTWNSTSSSSRESFVLFPDSGFAGNIVTITGTGFAPNIPVAIKFDAVLVATDPATVTTDNNALLLGLTYLV